MGGGGRPEEAAPEAAEAAAAFGYPLEYLVGESEDGQESGRRTEINSFSLVAL